MVQPSPQRAPAIAFPYYWGDVLVNVKYRALGKKFWQVSGGQQVLYGLNDLQGATAAIIVEGELDKLAIDSALDQPGDASTAVLSLPGGALPQGKPDPHSSKLACVDAAARQLLQLQNLIIAVDGDAPGHATAEALATKLQLLQKRATQQGGRRSSRPAGRTQQPAALQLWLLHWPSAPGGQGTLAKAAEEAARQGIQVDPAAAAGCKDANDVSRVCGPAFLRHYLSHARKLYCSISVADGQLAQTV